MAPSIYPRILCTLPGLAPAWLLGYPLALLELLAFTLLFNSLLIATWIWPNWSPVWVVRGGWGLCLTFWLVSALHAWWRLPKWLGRTPRIPQVDHFLQAQAEYLQGHWFEAEALVTKRLTECPGDSEAALLLAGILRRTKRFQQASTCLMQLRLRESAVPWLVEIEREQELLRQETEESDP